MILILKLITGVEVAGEVEAEDDKGIMLKHPMQIHYRYYTGELPFVTLMPYMMFADESSTYFGWGVVVNYAQARPAFAAVYEEGASSHYTEGVRATDQQLSGSVANNNTEAFYKALLETIQVEGALKN